MERNFWKMKEVFVKDKTNNKILSQFLHNHHILGDMMSYLRPIFQNFTKLDLLIKFWNFLKFDLVDLQLPKLIWILNLEYSSLKSHDFLFS